jgi:hypothetical protein
MPIAVDGNDNGSYNEKMVCSGGKTCTLVPQQDYNFHRHWKINGGALEIKSCGTVASISSSVFPPNIGAEIRADGNEKNWKQQWTVIAHEPILANANDSPNQEWEAHFVDPPYDYALVPGFPGSDSTGCLSSRNEPELAKAAMHFCDISMELLTGKQTSLGTLKAIADLVNDEGQYKMPGSCCFDTPTSNDAYFGINVSQSLHSHVIFISSQIFLFALLKV